MKFLLALFMVSMSLQPLAVQACPMEANHDLTHHVALQDEANPECCNLDAGKPVHDCEKALHCGSLSPGFVVIPVTSGIVPSDSSHRYLVTDGDRYSGPPAHPLFRPPIA